MEFKTRLHDADTLPRVKNWRVLDRERVLLRLYSGKKIMGFETFAIQSSSSSPLVTPSGESCGSFTVREMSVLTLLLLKYLFGIPQ